MDGCKHSSIMKKVNIQHYKQVRAIYRMNLKGKKAICFHAIEMLI